MSGHGKWSQAGVPRKGWSCIGTTDFGDLIGTCEMCEDREIRYVHHMEHQDYSEVLDCGCVCSEKMEENYHHPKRREADMKNIARRRGNWLSRKWGNSRKGNHFIRTDGFHIVIFETLGQWSGAITKRISGESTKARKLYSSRDAAKIAAFEGMIWLKGKNNENSNA